MSKSQTNWILFVRSVCVHTFACSLLDHFQEIIIFSKRNLPVAFGFNIFFYLEKCQRIEFSTISHPSQVAYENSELTVLDSLALETYSSLFCCCWPRGHANPTNFQYVFVANKLNWHLHAIIVCSVLVDLLRTRLVRLTRSADTVIGRRKFILWVFVFRSSLGRIGCPHVDFPSIEISFRSMEGDIYTQHKFQQWKEQNAKNANWKRQTTHKAVNTKQSIRIYRIASRWTAPHTRFQCSHS